MPVLPRGGGSWLESGLSSEAGRGAMRSGAQQRLPHAVPQSCPTALCCVPQCDENCVKALFHMGRAYLALRQFSKVRPPVLLGVSQPAWVGLARGRFCPSRASRENGGGGPEARGSRASHLCVLQPAVGLWQGWFVPPSACPVDANLQSCLCASRPGSATRRSWPPIPTKGSCAKVSGTIACRPPALASPPFASKQAPPPASRRGTWAFHSPAPAAPLRPNLAPWPPPASGSSLGPCSRPAPALELPDCISEVDAEEKRQLQEERALEELRSGEVAAVSVSELLQKLSKPGEDVLYYAGGIQLLTDILQDCELL